MSELSDCGSDDLKPLNSNDLHQDSDDVCRDFLRNSCRRGKRCKYRHPAHHSGNNNNNNNDNIINGNFSNNNNVNGNINNRTNHSNGSSSNGVHHHSDHSASNGHATNSSASVSASAMGSSSKPQPTFCHDFQNTGCHRPTCKFLHCSREEEEHFHQTGHLPSRMQPPAVAPQDVPLCRDFMKGECKRGPKCKYRHLVNDFPHPHPQHPNHHPHHHNSHHNHNNHHSHHQHLNDCGGDPRNDLGPGRPDLPPRHDGRLPPPHPSHPNDLRGSQNQNHAYNHIEDGYEKYDRYEYSHSVPSHALDGPQLKRRRVDMDGYASNGGSAGGGGGGGGGGGAGGISGGYESRYALGVPISSGGRSSYQYQVLEEENTALRRRVEELKKQVSDLTATNEVLLEQNARMRVAKSATVSTMQIPSQVLAPAVTPSLTLAQAPPTALQATVPLTTSLTHQIALNSDMATQHALHSAAQRMAREIHQQQQQQHQQQQHQQQQAAAAVAAAANAPPQRVPPAAPQQPPPLGPPPTLNPTVSMNPPLASLALPQNNLVAVSLASSLVTPSSLQQVGPPPGASMAQTLHGPPSTNPLVSYPIMSQDMRCAVAPSSLAH